MKQKLFVSLILLLCVVIVIFRYNIINIYLSYKFPSPVIVDGVEIEIDDGFVYSKQDNNGIRISDPLRKKYNVQINTEFNIPENSSLEDFVEGLGYMVVDAYLPQQTDNRYILLFSVNRKWLFSAFSYIPDKKIIIEYTGTKKYYRNFEEINKKFVEQKRGNRGREIAGK